MNPRVDHIKTLEQQLLTSKEVSLDLRTALDRSQELVADLEAVIGKQSETLLSDAEWIANASSKIRNQDNVIASQANTIAELRTVLAHINKMAKSVRKQV